MVRRWLRRWLGIDLLAQKTEQLEGWAQNGGIDRRTDAMVIPADIIGEWLNGGDKNEY